MLVDVDEHGQLGLGDGGVFPQISLNGKQQFGPVYSDAKTISLPTDRSQEFGQWTPKCTYLHCNTSAFAVVPQP